MANTASSRGSGAAHRRQGLRALSKEGITASFGVGEYSGQEAADTLVDRTDKLLYKAKELGRNRVMPLPS